LADLNFTELNNTITLKWQELDINEDRLLDYNEFKNFADVYQDESNLNGYIS